MQIHYTVPFIDYLKVYISGSYDVVIGSVRDYYTSNVKDAHVHYWTQFSRHMNIGVNRDSYVKDKIPASYLYTTLVSVTEMFKTRHVSDIRTCIEVKGQENVRIFMNMFPYLHKDVSTKVYRSAYRTGRPCKIIPLVKCELVAIDLAIDINSSRLGWPETLAIVEDVFYVGEMRRYRLSSMEGIKELGRTLYLGDTVHSAKSMRIYEKGKQLNIDYGRMNGGREKVYPDSWIRVEEVFKLSKEKRIALTPDMTIDTAYHGMVREFINNP